MTFAPQAAIGDLLKRRGMPYFPPRMPFTLIIPRSSTWNFAICLPQRDQCAPRSTGAGNRGPRHRRLRRRQFDI